MIAHHIVDVLLGNVKTPKLIDILAPTRERCERAAKLLRVAQKFDFRTLVLEPNPDLVSAGKHGWKMPRLTPNEIEFWIEGLLPLPFPVVWYEFTLGGSRSGLLVYESDDGNLLHTERIDWNGEHGVLYDGLVATVDRSKTKPDDMEIEVVGESKVIAALEATARMQLLMDANVGSSPYLSLYFTLMLHSRTTEIATGPKPDPALQKRRVQRGREPLPAHRIVTIVPDRYWDVGEHQGGTHRPPRLHWRRSHKRHYEESTPSAKWVPNENYRGRLGWWVSIIPRHLVGRADLGEVSHEYRIERADEPEKEPA